MKWPWVSRLAYELALAELGAERARADLLMVTLSTMRQQGFAIVKPATVREPKDEETEGLARAEQELVKRRDDMGFINRAAADMMRRIPGLSPARALEEAGKLRREINDQDSPT